MFNLDIFKENSFRAAVALGAIVGVVTFSASAGAGPLPLFPFVTTGTSRATGRAVPGRRRR
jgi:hypothetical protein